MCQSQKPTLSPQYGIIPQGVQLAIWWHWTTSIIEWTLFCPYWNRCLLWIRICLPWVQCFWQNYRPWTYRMPVHNHDILHIIASAERTHFKRSAEFGPSSCNRVKCSLSLTPSCSNLCFSMAFSLTAPTYIACRHANHWRNSACSLSFPKTASPIFSSLNIKEVWTPYFLKMNLRNN